nr:MAG TPA: hypothetical protein [Caudoviricetes sp.]
MEQSYPGTLTAAINYYAMTDNSLYLWISKEEKHNGTILSRNLNSSYKLLRNDR